MTVGAIASVSFNQKDQTTVDTEERLSGYKSRCEHDWIKTKEYCLKCGGFVYPLPK